MFWHNYIILDILFFFVCLLYIMSLVVLSNQQSFSSGVAQNIENPVRFQNSFSKSVEIPPDSEVAVVSAKINRSNLFDTGDQANFKLYLGEELSQIKSLQDVISSPFTIDLSVNGGSKQLSPLELANRVEDSINEEFFHPEFIARTVVNASFDSDGAFEGLQFIYSASKNGVANSSAVGSEFVAFNLESEGNASSSSSGTYGQVIEGLGGSVESNVFVGTQRPLAPSGGIFEFIPSNASNNETSWAVGLSRSLPIYGLNNENTDLEDILKPLFDGDTMPGTGEVGYCDYMIVNDEDGNLQVYQTGQSGGLTGLDEIAYYDNTTNSSATGGVYFSSASFSSYRFRLENEKLFIEGYEWATVRDYIPICSPIDTSGVAFDEVTRPVSQNEWSLYPVFQLHTQNDFIEITQFNGAYKPGDVDISYSAETFYSQLFPLADNPNSLEYLDIANSIDVRPVMTIGGTINKTYAGLRSAGANVSVDYNIVMIFEEEVLYTPRYLYPIPNNSVAESFGYNTAVVDETNFAVLSDHDSVRTFDPVQSATQQSIREAFIKLDSLNIESFNGATSAISKIIYGIPRFDNSGASVGPLYFQNPDRYYLKLNNPAPIQLNRMDVSIVNVDQTLVQDLYGHTIITIHIRPSPK
jgi:hypothetical protein